MMTTPMTDPAGARAAYLALFLITAPYRDLCREDNSNPFAPMVAKFVDDIVKADENITRCGQQIIHRIQQVTEHVSLGFHINKLGELQRTPVEFDQACIARETAIENATLAAKRYHHAQRGARA